MKYIAKKRHLAGPSPNRLSLKKISNYATMLLLATPLLLFGDLLTMSLYFIEILPLGNLLASSMNDINIYFL